MQHIIKKQVIALSLDKELDAFHIQQKISNYYFDKIVPLLQQAFDAASGEEETISIDNLEIDLGTITIKEIEKGNWDEKVFKKVSEQLISVKHGLSSQIKVTKQPHSLSISEQWIFYMRHGYLPWNVLEINDDWYKKVIEAFAVESAAISNLRNLINHYPDSAKRMVTQNSEDFLKALVETLTAENQGVLVHSINEFINNSKKDFVSKNKKLYRQKLWEQVLTLSASEEKSLTPSKISAALLTQELNEAANKFVKEGYLKDRIVQNKNNDVSEEGIYVSNAGIILLHPFLHQFFKTLQLVQEEDFIDILTQTKALYLLHYLAAGNTNPEEHELVVAKVLCAFPLKDPVDNFIELSEKELGEADELLLSSIHQWSILKGTSPDGLREGFLQRKGKLFTKNGNLVLQIEQGSIDMLLDHLPWNLSMIQLPWMEDVLKVEWR